MSPVAEGWDLIIKDLDADLLELEADEEEGEKILRPYLPVKIRSRLDQISRSELCHFFKPGEILHVDMSEAEMIWIVKTCKRMQRLRVHQDWQEISKDLNGRSPGDVENFWKDYAAGLISQSPQHTSRQAIIVGNDSLVMKRPKPIVERTKTGQVGKLDRWSMINNRAFTTAPIRSARSMTAGYYPSANWACCSGSVISMATTNNCLPNGLYTCLIGSATQTDLSRQRTGLQDPYNRSGELCAIEMNSTAVKCRVLDGHRTFAADGHEHRCTVTSVVHSDNNSAYIAGGYDGFVSAWSDDRLGLLTRFGDHKCSINAIASDTKSYGIIYGTSNGDLIWCADPLSLEDGKAKLHRLASIQHPQGQSIPLANSVDMLAMTTKHSSSLVFSGIGYLSACQSGMVQCYDLAALSLLNCIKIDADACLTDIALHPDEQLLAMATGILVGKKNLKGDGKLRLSDLRKTGGSSVTTEPQWMSMATEITTNQFDIHRVAFSPCGQLIYSNDASTGLMLVHDLRYSIRPLWFHNHSTQTRTGSPQDHFIGFSWANNKNGVLFTGGNDGYLKIWDLGQVDSLIEAHDFGQPVNNVAVSADNTHLWAGTEFGNVVMLSQNESLRAAFEASLLVSHDPPNNL